MRYHTRFYRSSNKSEDQINRHQVSIKKSVKRTYENKLIFILANTRYEPASEVESDASTGSLISNSATGNHQSSSQQHQPPIPFKRGKSASQKEADKSSGNPGVQPL